MRSALVTRNCRRHLRVCLPDGDFPAKCRINLYGAFHIKSAVRLVTFYPGLKGWTLWLYSL